MNGLELFAGVGGGILAGELLGWRTVCAVEISPWRCRRLMQRQNEGHLPPFPIWDDVRTFDGYPWRGIVDVVSGGFPCQDVSQLGKRTGIDGERSGLWLEMARIIREVRPRFVFVENAAGLLHRGFDRVLSDLAGMGFDARWGMLGSNDIGAPHGRKRIWILADAAKRDIPLGRDMARIKRERQSITQYGYRPILCEPGFLGKPIGMADRLDRLRAIGDGQDCRVAATAFRILAG